MPEVSCVLNGLHHAGEGVVRFVFKLLPLAENLRKVDQPVCVSGQHSIKYKILVGQALIVAWWLDEAPKPTTKMISQVSGSQNVGGSVLVFYWPQQGGIIQSKSPCPKTNLVMQEFCKIQPSLDRLDPDSSNGA